MPSKASRGGVRNDAPFANSSRFAPPGSRRRLAAGYYELAPNSKPWEFAVLLVRIFRSLDALVGSRDEVMRTWLGSHNRGINGVPATLMASAEGMVRVLNYLDANRGLV
jgi:hypothetical protein